MQSLTENGAGRAELLQFNGIGYLVYAGESTETASLTSSAAQIQPASSPVSAIGIITHAY